MRNLVHRLLFTFVRFVFFARTRNACNLSLKIDWYLFLGFSPCDFKHSLIWVSILSWETFGDKNFAVIMISETVDWIQQILAEVYCFPLHHQICTVFFRSGIVFVLYHFRLIVPHCLLNLPVGALCESHTVALPVHDIWMYFLSPLLGWIVSRGENLWTKWRGILDVFHCRYFCAYYFCDSGPCTTRFTWQMWSAWKLCASFSHVFEK